MNRPPNFDLGSSCLPNCAVLLGPTPDTTAPMLWTVKSREGTAPSGEEALAQNCGLGKCKGTPNPRGVAECCGPRDYVRLDGPNR